MAERFAGFDVEPSEADLERMLRERERSPEHQGTLKGGEAESWRDAWRRKMLEMGVPERLAHGLTGGSDRNMGFGLVDLAGPLPAAADAVGEWSRGHPGAAAMAALGAVPIGKGGKLAGKAAPSYAEKYAAKYSFPAFHGTNVPYYSIPSASKVKSGEGNLDFGWGHYVTESEALGEKYAKDITAQKGVGEPKVHVQNIDAGRSTFMHWYKPFEEQPSVVREALGNFFEQNGLDPVKLKGLTGEQVYGIATELKGGQQEASKVLHNFGVPGIKYPTSHTKKGKSDTSNYVLFNHSDALGYGTKSPGGEYTWEPSGAQPYAWPDKPEGVSTPGASTQPSGMPVAGAGKGVYDKTPHPLLETLKKTESWMPEGAAGGAMSHGAYVKASDQLWEDLSNGKISNAEYDQKYGELFDQFTGAGEKPSAPAAPAANVYEGLKKLLDNPPGPMPKPKAQGLPDHNLSNADYQAMDNANWAAYKKGEISLEDYQSKADAMTEHFAKYKKPEQGMGYWDDGVDSDFKPSGDTLEGDQIKWGMTPAEEAKQGFDFILKYNKPKDYTEYAEYITKLHKSGALSDNEYKALATHGLNHHWIASKTTVPWNEKPEVIDALSNASTYGDVSIAIDQLHGEGHLTQDEVSKLLDKLYQTNAMWNDSIDVGKITGVKVKPKDPNAIDWHGTQPWDIAEKIKELSGGDEEKAKALLLSAPRRGEGSKDYMDSVWNDVYHNLKVSGVLPHPEEQKFPDPRLRFRDMEKMTPEQRMLYKDDLFPESKLPQDAESRAKREADWREQGPDMDLYTGVPQRDAERRDAIGFVDPSDKREAGIFLTDQPDIAKSYAEAGGALDDYARGRHTFKLRARATNPKVMDWNEISPLNRSYDSTSMKRAINEAWLAGHDLLRIDNMGDVGGIQSQWIVRNPNQLRSPLAHFDPKHKKSRNLLRAAAPIGVGGAAAASAGKEKRDE